MGDIGGEPVGRSIDALVGRMELLLQTLEPGDARRHFHSTYTRTTKAIADELRTGKLGGFVDPDWVERWDVAFAELYLGPFLSWQESGEAPGPWAAVFRTARDRPELTSVRHVLFGINVHVNFDLSRALLAVITDDEFDDPELRSRRGLDHVHIDKVLESRVAAEDREITDKTFLDRLLTPLNRRATARFLKEAREKVWRNAAAMSRARRRGPEALEARVRELEGLCEARVTDLVAPGQVVLKLARRGFGVLLSGA
jgi:uncharacterized protein DUF5995